MIPSIRTFLVINLLLSLALITSLSVVGNLYLEHKHMQHNIDARLIEITIRLNNFLETGVFNKLSSKRKMAIPVPLLHSSTTIHHQTSYLSPDYSLIQYQIYSDKGQLILRSSGAPSESFAGTKNGFTNITLNNSSWRIYTAKNPKTGMVIVVGESYAFLQALESRITQDSILIMLVTYPLLAILIWVIVGRGFNGVNRLAKEIKRRDEQRLEPIDTDHIPSEIQPFIIELNHLFFRLNETFQREKRFAGDAAHELRTPLAVLKTQAQVALKATETHERNRAITHLIAGVERCTHVVQQLLTMSKMVPEATLNDIIPINLAELAIHVISNLAPTAVHKDIDIELVSEDRKPTMMQGNKTAIEILIQNLIDNAIRYTPNHGHVRVTIVQSLQHVILSVEDDGPGIPVTLRKRVFERFFRIVGTSANGSGLGLGIVKKIADLHHASLLLNTPKNGKGLLITVTFLKNIKAKLL
jgi:two-component system, OmpR family, sensor histidine kinase QseC